MVSNALDAKQIQTRNIKAIKDQVNEALEEYMIQAQLAGRELLHEKIEATAKGRRSHRELPLPPNARWSKKNGLQSTEEYLTYIQNNP